MLKKCLAPTKQAMAEAEKRFQSGNTRFRVGRIFPAKESSVGCPQRARGGASALPTAPGTESGIDRIA